MLGNSTKPIPFIPGILVLLEQSLAIIRLLLNRASVCVLEMVATPLLIIHFSMILSLGLAEKKASKLYQIL